MNNTVVTVLTPNGRRQNVKVHPNKTVLQILEEVCQKHHFEPSNFDLKHHKRILDLSQSYRFTGLPNNAQIEMVERTGKKRTETDVEIMLQLEDGSRISGSFNPSVTLMAILRKQCPDRCEDKDLIVVYMRTEVFGDALNEITLRSLGLTSGRAILRIIRKNPEDLKIQANVSAPLLSRASNTIKSENQMEVDETLEVMTISFVSSMNDIDEKPDEDLKDTKNAQTVVSPQNRKKIKVEFTQKEEVIDEAVIENEGVKNTNDEHIIANNDEDVNQLEEDFHKHVLGERDAVLFSLDNAERTSFDIHDSFFELSVHDVRVLLRDLHAQAQIESDAPLLTQKMREMESATQTLTKLNKYKKAIIRIQFHDRLVLQGTFAPIETIATVMEFTRPYLVSPDIDFHLYTTPPKRILPIDSRLVELQCVPTALLHFGIDFPSTNESFIKKEYLEKVTTPTIALVAASKVRGISPIINDSSLENNEGGAIGGSTSQRIVGGDFKPSSVSIVNTDVKIPKWFKPTQK